ncbi:MAG: hypothetical protein IJW00_01730 [Clostridia bacterium]|nr:hypothetical protein [Clostridia bacterium]
MKSKIAIIVLSVLLALSLVASCIFFLHVQKRNEKYIRDAEAGWEDYLFWCDMSEVDPMHDYEDVVDGEYRSAMSFRCFHNESFDFLADGTCTDGLYLYDLFIFEDNTGLLVYRHYIHVAEEVEEDGETYIVGHNELYENAHIPLTAEEVKSVVDVMVEWDYARLYTYAPEGYMGVDGNTTFMHFSASLLADEPYRDFRNHLVTEWCAEEGSGVYEIRKAIEALIIAHDAGSVPKQYWPEDWK